MNTFGAQRVVMMKLKMNKMTVGVTCLTPPGCPCAGHRIPVSIRSCSTDASLMEINNVSHESLVHTQGQRSHSSCNLYASEML